MKSDYLKPTTYNELYRVMQRDNVLAIRVAVETGLRIDDVLRLKWENFGKSTQFTYLAKKTGKKGVKKLSKQLKNELYSRNVHNSAYVFPGRKRGTHRTRQAVWKDIKKAADLMGVPLNVSPHSARKTYAVELRKERGLADVQKELQHSDMTTTMLYAFSDMARGGKRGAIPDTGDLIELADLIAERVMEKLRSALEPGCPYLAEAKRKETD